MNGSKKPLIFAVDSQEGSLQRFQKELHKRYGGDHEIVAVDSPTVAQSQLKEKSEEVWRSPSSRPLAG